MLRDQFFNIFKWKSSSRYSLVRSLQKCSKTFSFLKCPSGNRALATGSCAVCRLHLPKVLRYYLQILNISQWKSSFCYSLVHILSTSSSKSAPNPTVFQNFHVEVELSLLSCAHFVDPVTASSESAPKPTVFYDFI